MSKINVGYSYLLTGNIDIDLKDFEEFCTSNEVEPYEDNEINPDSLREYLIENFDLIEIADDGKLDWIEDHLQINSK